MLLNGFFFYIISNISNLKQILKDIHLLNILLQADTNYIKLHVQYWFKIYGPFNFFYGLITWYKPIISSTDGVSGLFSNQNYTGFWLSIVWPSFNLFY